MKTESVILYTCTVFSFLSLLLFFSNHFVQTKNKMPVAWNILKNKVKKTLPIRYSLIVEQDHSDLQLEFCLTVRKIFKKVYM